MVSGCAFFFREAERPGRRYGTDSVATKAMKFPGFNRNQDRAPSLTAGAAHRLHGFLARLTRQNSAAVSVGQPPASPAARLTSLAGSLAELTRRTDPDFVQLATDLKSLHTCATELGRSIGDHAGTVRDTLQGSRLSGADGLAARSLNGLQSGMDNAAGNLAALMAVAGALGQLHSQGGQIGRIAMILKSSGCTFAVESARSVNCQQAFGSFVEELRSLAGKIATLGEVIGGQSKNTQTKLEHLTQVITGNLEQLRQLTQRSEATVRQTTGQMQQLLDSSCQALQQAEKRTRQIARHADDVVYHLQFGDIVRQRLEHIVASLEDAAEAFSSNGGNSPDKAARILDIQLGQLEAMMGEVEETRRQLLEAFSGLGQESGGLADSIRHLEGPAKAEQTDKNPFDELKSELLRLEDLQRQGHRLCGQANETSQQAIESASQLSQHLDEVQEINREMHLQALNAIIKTALLGDEGRTLEVLSTHVHTVFQESSGLVAETIRILEQVRSHANSTGTDTAAASADDPADLQAGLAQIARVHGQFQQITVSALALVERQNATLQEVRERLDFLAALAGRISAFSDEVRKLRNVMPAIKEGLVSDDDLVSLNRRYTMESERAVHRRILGITGERAMSDLSKSTAAAEENLEFFDAPTPPAEAVATGPTLKNGKQENADNIEFF
jgi:hypothetical protein